MLHAPVIGSATPKLTTVTTTRQPLTPAAYVALRRRTSKLDIAQVAALIAVKAGDQAKVRALVRQLETPGVVALDLQSSPCSARRSRSTRTSITSSPPSPPIAIPRFAGAAAARNGIAAKAGRTSAAVGRRRTSAPAASVTTDAD